MSQALRDQERSDRWLAQKVNRDPATIGNWRKGKTEPRAEDMILCAKALGIDINDLLNQLSSGEKGGAVREQTEEYSNNIPRKEGVVEIPLFPKALDLLSGLHQSQNGLTIDLTMAKSRLPIAESLYQEGMFAVDTYHLVDCDDDYGIAAVIPWNGEVETGKPILFTTEQADELFIRRVLVHEGGKFLFRESYKGSNSVLDREIEVIGILKLKIEQL